MAVEALTSAKRTTLACIQCGKQFTYEKIAGRNRGLCSVECAAARVNAKFRARYKPKRYVHSCHGCAGSFESSRPEAKFCSRRCSTMGKPTQHTRPTEQRPCRRCGCAFTVRRDNDRRYCTDHCRTADAALKLAERRGTRVSVTTHHRPCEGCGSRFHTTSAVQRYCSLGCREEQTRQAAFVHTRAEKVCSYCGGQFSPTHGSTVYCCETCRTEASKLLNKASGAKATARQRRKAKQRGVTVESVNPLTVLTRDGWRCQLCGNPTPKRLRGTYEPNAPEVDHIVPLSKGGEHSYRNTQCACRKCNLAKSGDIKGQMRLFG